MDRDPAELVPRESAPSDLTPSPRQLAMAQPRRAGRGDDAGNGVIEASSAAAPAADDRAPAREAPAEEEHRYLAPAMRAAAAAKARAARIRSAQYMPEHPECAGWTPIHWVPPTPAAPSRGPGLSVAQAAAASPIAFRPLRQAATEPPYRTDYRPLAPEAPAAEPGATEPPGTAAAPLESHTSAVRFSKTVAELQRHRAGDARAEPWGQMVPRPAGPRRDEPVRSPEGRSDVRSNSLGLLWRYVRRSESGSGATG